jgi:chromate transport protein ChrA
MSVLAYGYAHVASLSAIASIRRGVLAVVIALLLGTMFRLSAQIVTTPSTRAIAVGAFVVAGTLPIASPWVLVIAGLIGLMAYRERPR